MYYAFRVNRNQYLHDPADNVIGSGKPYHTQGAAEAAAREVSQREASFVAILNVLDGTPDETEYSGVVVAIFYYGNRFVPDAYSRNLVPPDAIYGSADILIQHARDLLKQLRESRSMVTIDQNAQAADADLELVQRALRSYAGNQDQTPTDSPPIA